MLRLYFILWFLFIYKLVFAKELNYENYYALKNNNKFNEIKKLLKDNKNHKMYEAFKWHSEYFSIGNYDNSNFIKINLNNISRDDLAFYYLLYGYHIKLYLPKEIEKSTEFFFKGYEIAKKENNITLQNEALYLIIADLLHNENSLKLAPKFIKIYENTANSNYHKFWSGFMKFMYEIAKSELEKTKSKIKEEDMCYLKKFTNHNNFSISSYYNLLGLYHYNKKNIIDSEKYFKISKSYKEKINYYYAQISTFNENVNIASSLIDNKKHKEGIKILKRNKIPNLAIPFAINYYKNLANAYENIKMADSALYYTKMVDSLTIKKETLESNFQHQYISSKFELQEKEEKIKSLSKNKILYFSLIFLVFLLALYSFIRWKKVDINKKKISQEKDNLELEKENLELLKENLVLEKENLEIQHHQTLEQLEKVKQLVIEDHIILKNKAKIYLEELIYIKAEDHYLQLMTTHKKEFVRGKLSEIIEQLPPNFVKCHRSYIININYIKQNLTSSIIMKNNDEIPVARGIKL